MVRPPGKRLQRLAMLSGGERALTGVALLFAMLTVNPVPFCILDEVDAALDEANIGRFAQALRKLAESIDFVVITHNRATIEVADTIYGVTMTDAAVSRVLSLAPGRRAGRGERLMFRRRRDEPARRRPAARTPPRRRPSPDPRREPAGMGLRARPSGLGARLRSILGGGAPATEATWDEVEEALIAADVGATATLELVDAARRALRARRRSQRRGRASRAGHRDPRSPGGASDRARSSSAPAPSVILFVGRQRHGQDHDDRQARAPAAWPRAAPLALAAADTFRAAAIEQLRIWGEQLGVPVVAQRAGADPGAVAFDAVAAAESRGLDAVLVDTAGRLQNKQQLMDELAKIRRVIERRLPGQPRHVLLVLDATTGQNGLLQAEAFSREAGVTGIVLTKLDGSAKGGVALAVADRLGVPIVFAGVGEEIDALAPFDPEAFVEWLFAE